jgi:MFS family permease
MRGDSRVVRIFLGLVTGVLVAFTVTAIGEAVGHWFYPPPAGTDLSNPQALQTLIETLPGQAIAAVLLAWAAGSFAGGAVAGLIGKRRWVALAIGGAMLAAAAGTMVVIPHPAWFMIASVPAIMLPAWLAGHLLPDHGLGMPEKK